MDQGVPRIRLENYLYLTFHWILESIFLTTACNWNIFCSWYYLNALPADLSRAVFGPWLSPPMLESGTSWDPDAIFSKFLWLEWVLSHSSMKPSSKSLWPSLGTDLGFTRMVLPSTAMRLLQQYLRFKKHLSFTSRLKIF